MDRSIICMFVWLVAPSHTHLLLNSMGLGHHGIEVMAFGNAVEHQLLDLHLQVCIGALQ